MRLNEIISTTEQNCCMKTQSSKSTMKTMRLYKSSRSVHQNQVFNSFPTGTRFSHLSLEVLLPTYFYSFSFITATVLQSDLFWWIILQNHGWNLARLTEKSSAFKNFLFASLIHVWFLIFKQLKSLTVTVNKLVSGTQLPSCIRCQHLPNTNKH